MEILCNPFSIARKVKRPLILDGANGTLLYMKGAVPERNLWMSYCNLTNPELVEEVHKEYIASGADIITTNTFRTNPLSVNRSTIRDADIMEKSVGIALNAVEGTSVIIAGSNPPAEDCYQMERMVKREVLEENHFAHITSLYRNGAHFVLNETQSHWDEIELICMICKDEDIPFIVSLYFDENLRIKSGETVMDAIELVSEFSPLAIGFNCIKPAAFSRLIQRIKPEFNWGFYLNCGDGDFHDEKINCGISPQEYIILVKEALTYSPSFIGACCGSGPEHIKQIKEMFDERVFNYNPIQN